MGWKLKVKEMKLKPNEEQDISFILEPERRAAIHGVVRFPNGKPVAGAIVKLFEKKNSCTPCDLKPITFAFTDACGQFLFGVDSCVDYFIKVFYYEPECFCAAAEAKDAEAEEEEDDDDDDEEDEEDEDD